MKALKSVLIVEPSEIIFEGLRSLLEEAGGFNVLSPMHDALSLEERLPVIRPDILILNPTLLSAVPRQSQTASPRQLLNSIAAQRPAMPVIALLYQYVESSLLEVFQYQLDIRCGRSVMLSLLNNSVKSESLKEKEQPEVSENYELSERETDVLVLVAKGCSSKEIADILHISVHTVNSHRKNITHKTGIKSVAGLAVYAMIHNLT